MTLKVVDPSKVSPYFMRFGLHFHGQNLGGERSISIAKHAKRSMDQTIIR